MFKRLFLCCFLTLSAFCAEHFVLWDETACRMVRSTDGNERVSPCSTFKIALSLMGFDAAILQDEAHPEWPFKPGYRDYIESWKQPQTPKSWMQRSCVWYSEVLAQAMGMDEMQRYLTSFDYGNQDLNGVEPAWLSSSLQISPNEQVVFLSKILQGALPVASYAIEMTKSLLLLEEWEGWKLFGKTGTGDELGWFVGWIEKGDQTYIFAYLIQGQNIDRLVRISRTKELINLEGLNVH